MVLGLMAEWGRSRRVPKGRRSPARSGRANEATVQVSSSDAARESWVNFRQVLAAGNAGKGESRRRRGLRMELAEGMLNRLVRAQMIKGSATKDKGKAGLSDPDRQRVAAGLEWTGGRGDGQQGRRNAEGFAMFSVSPRKSLTVPASEEVVRTLGLKKGIKVVALDLSGL